VKNRLLPVMLLLVLFVFLTSNAQAITPLSATQTDLVYVNLVTSDDLSHFASTQLPLFSLLEGGLLTGADQVGQQSLQEAGLSFQVIDPDLRSGTYYLAATFPSRPAPHFTQYGQVLLNLPEGVLLRMDSSQAEAITQAGAELRVITLIPKPLPAVQSEAIFPEVVTPDTLIQGMINQVTETQVYTYDQQLAGELPVWVDDNWYIITSRYTYSGTPIQKTTHYVYQHMQELGLNVNYQQWGEDTYPNVIGEIPGQTNPDDIFIIGAHIDDVQGTPGADDNASGSVASLLAADILSQYQWGCTLRFAFWTGEEQGLFGSHFYAQQAFQSGENIRGYLNLDMIAWNTKGSQPGIDLLYRSSMPSTLELAQLFADVVNAYNINLVPQFVTSLGGGSDHSSFWDYGYTSILAIEDQSDFNPYYHGAGDTPAHTNPAFFTDFVKASIATYAHMSGCLIAPDEGYLDGHVNAASDGAAIEGVTVTSQNGHGHTYLSTTDTSGYYTITLPVDTYTVTASAYGYMPVTASGLSIISDTITTQDFTLQPACEPLSGLDFSWEPHMPIKEGLVSFTATASGTLPIDYQWDFGDSYTGTGVTISHSYMEAGEFTIAVSATNACDTQQVSKHITIYQWLWEFFLPLLYRQ
jgi:hypothetical protein